MNDESDKFEAFGRMVFGMMTDVLVLPDAVQAYARKTVTMPDGRGGKHRLDLIVARPAVADAMEKTASERFDVVDVKSTGVKQ